MFPPRKDKNVYELLNKIGFEKDKDLTTVFIKKNYSDVTKKSISTFIGNRVKKTFEKIGIENYSFALMVSNCEQLTHTP